MVEEADYTKEVNVMIDKYNRPINYVRISITDRCNLRCKYCMPNGVTWEEHEKIISYEEIIELCTLLTKLGINKIKVTGGEPLVRKDCIKLIASLKALPGIEEVTLTTNGVLLKDNIDALVKAKLDAINISLDTMNRERFLEITGKDEYLNVIEAIKIASKTNLKVKINCVAIAGSDDYKDILLLAKDYPLDVRFIEMMPIGLGKTFTTLDNQIILDYIKNTYGSVGVDDNRHGNGPAHYYKVAGFKGSVGFIGAINHKFCNQCNRIRLTSKGYLKTCLCFDKGIDALALIHSNLSDEQKVKELYSVIYDKPKEHSFLEESKITEKNNMSSIGG